MTTDRIRQLAFFGVVAALLLVLALGKEASVASELGYRSCGLLHIEA
jgi:hypothetical protein